MITMSSSLRRCLGHARSRFSRRRGESLRCFVQSLCVAKYDRNCCYRAGVWPCEGGLSWMPRVYVNGQGTASVLPVLIVEWQKRSSACGLLYLVVILAPRCIYSYYNDLRVTNRSKRQVAILHSLLCVICGRACVCLDCTQSRTPGESWFMLGYCEDVNKERICAFNGGNMNTWPRGLVDRAATCGVVCWYQWAWQPAWH
jgi:hypothetical protein